MLNKYKGSTKDLYVWNDMNEFSVFNGPEVRPSLHGRCDYLLAGPGSGQPSVNSRTATVCCTLPRRRGIGSKMLLL